MGADLASIRRDVESWSKPWQKLFTGILEDLDGLAPKEQLVRKAHDILVKRREGRKAGFKWWRDEDGSWRWSPPPGDPPF